VTTSFSQGATFYAGETVACTISFTYSVQAPTTEANGMPIKNQSRPHSWSALEKAHDQRRKSLINSKTFVYEVESLALANIPPSRKLSLNSLASSTFSYLTGSTALTGKESNFSTDMNERKGSVCLIKLKKKACLQYILRRIGGRHPNGRY
jgi:hypothetical protein